MSRILPYPGGMEIRQKPLTVDDIHAMLAVELDTQTDLGVSDKGRWLANPGVWAKERAGVHLWSKQREIIESVRDNKRTAVPSCHAVGKTFCAASVAGWWLDVHTAGTAFVASTAPTAPQVKALLWREINRLHKRADLPGRTNLTEWYIDGELVGIGRKPSEYNVSSFQGIHAPYVLAILDEAGGVPEVLWTAIETITANEDSRILAIGNPDIPNEEFHKVCRPESGWKVVKIGYADSPNFSGEEVPKNISDQLISASWVEEMKQKWGEDSALYSSKILGEFPSDEADPWKVIPSKHLLPCRRMETIPIPGEPVEAGIDIGGGGDRTVLVARRGPRVENVQTFRNADPMATVGQLVNQINELGIERVKVDVIGIGWGVCGRLKELSTYHNPRTQRAADEITHSAEVTPVNFANQAANPKRFLNKRAEVWWNIGREYSRRGKWDLSAISDDDADELLMPKYEIMDSMGKIKIEPKDDIKKRLGRSPDVGDAILLAYYTAGRDENAPATAGFAGITGQQGGRSSVFAPAAGGRRSVFGR